MTRKRSKMTRYNPASVKALRAQMAQMSESSVYGQMARRRPR